MLQLHNCFKINFWYFISLLQHLVMLVLQLKANNQGVIYLKWSNHLPLNQQPDKINQDLIQDLGHYIHKLKSKYILMIHLNNLNDFIKTSNKF